MVVISPGAGIPTDLAVFYTTDPTQSNSPIFAFYGASATSIANPTNTSRVQCHIFATAGLRSYPRLAISPSSPLYQAVSCLPREEQGDEVCRGLAFALLKYFSEIPETAKDIWKEKASTSSRSQPKLFSETHAACLASRMQQLSGGKQIIEEVNAVLAAQSLSYLDAEVILPPGSMRVPAASSTQEGCILQDDDLGSQYGKYSSLVKLFGEPLFLPTSKVRRAPSKTTPIGHGTIASTNQMMKLKTEIYEMVETEERYVGKMTDLVRLVVENFRLAADMCEEDIQTCKRLFPRCLDEICRLNTSFLEECSHVLEEAESTSQASNGLEMQLSDVDIMLFTKCCLKWFPRFSTSYTEYISAHAGLGEYVKGLASQPDSVMGKVLSGIGERKLMSMLIEPIQRLPRYNLYLNNMIKQLPVLHPAVKLLLTSKDIITEICAHESSSADDLRIVRLRSMVISWPSDFPPSSRLLVAVDVVELKLPYNTQRSVSPATGSILLLFTTCMVLLERCAETTISSRILLAEIDQPFTTQRHIVQNGLKCTAWWMLSTISTSEFDNGSCIVLSPAHTQTTPTMKVQHNRLSATPPETRVFRLSGHYEGKASRWSAEVGKARLEDRYSETTRESQKWDARSFEPAVLGLGLLTAIVEEDSEHVLHQRQHHAPLRIVIEPSLHKSTIKSSQSGNEIVARITAEDQGWSRLEVEVANDRPTTDHIFTIEILPVLIRRVTNALQMRYQIRNPAAAHCLHRYNETILRSLEIRSDEPTRSRSHHRSHSPVKAFTNLFSSTSSRDLGRDAMLQNTRILENVPRFQSSASPPELRTSPAKVIMPEEQDLGTIERVYERKAQKNPLIALESTLNSYVVALLARKGNVVGKVVARRTLAPEAEMNELYNVLLDDPDNLEHAAQVSIDVLFASFEKFLKTAWQENMGTIVDRPVIEHLESMYVAHNLSQQFGQAIRRLAPQNQRALRTIIDLLGQLLSSMSHDEDKGLLTEAFADMLITDGDPRDFIPLLDQLMCDDVAHQNVRSMTSQTPAAKAYATGSFSSKAASISKRFGFGSVRKENKQPDVSFTGSLRRTWSKGKSSESITAMNVFAIHSSLEESGPTSTAKYQTPQEPRTHDVINGAQARTGLTLDPITVSPFIPDIDPFTKTPSPVQTLPISTLAARSPNPSSPTNSSPTKQARPRSMYASTASGSPLKHNSELNRAMTVRVKPKPMIDATSPIMNGYHTMRERPAQLDQMRPSPENNDLRKSRLPLSCTPERQLLKLTPSPGLRGILCERNDSGNTPPRQLSPIKQVAAPAASPTKKLRIKSPTKPREQQLTIEGPAAQPGTEANFRHELSSITTTLADISSLNQSTELGNLAARLKALESSLSSFSSTSTTTASQVVPSEFPLPSTSDAIQQRLNDLETQLATAHAENSALYSRTNKELMAVFEQVRTGRGVEELMKKLAEEQKEARKWREVARKLLRERRAAGQVVKDVGEGMVKDEALIVPGVEGTGKTEEADVEIKIEEVAGKTEGNRENVRPSPTRLPMKARAEDKEKTMSMLGRGRPRLVNPGM